MAKKKSTKRDQLTQAQIVEASMKVLKNKGLEGFSMRQLAQSMGVTPMAMYRHVRDKNELMNLLGEYVLSKIRNVKIEGNWKEKCFCLHNGWRKVMLSYPEVGRLWLSRFIPSSTLNWIGDQLIIYAEEGGYSDMLLVKMVDALFIYTLGIINYELTRSPTVRKAQGTYLDPVETPNLLKYLPLLATRDSEDMYRTAYMQIIDGFEQLKNS